MSGVDALILELAQNNRKDVALRLKAAQLRDTDWGDARLTYLCDDPCAVCGSKMGTRATRYCEWAGGESLPNYGRNNHFRKRWRNTQPAYSKKGFQWQRKGCSYCCGCQQCLRRAANFILHDGGLDEMDVALGDFNDEEEGVVDQT